MGEISSTKPIPPKRDLGVEALRGLAILLMVVGHVIGIDRGAGLRVPDGSVWRQVYAAIDPVAMPLFALISGYVYAFKPVRRETLAKFFRGKVQRIVVPLLWVSLLTYVVRRYALGEAPYDWLNVWRLWVFQYDHFWFLHALLMLFVWVAAVDVLGLMRKVWMWALWLGVWLWLAWWSPAWGPFAHRPALLSLPSWWGVAPMFVLGVGLYRFTALMRREVVMAVMLATLVLMGAYQWRVWSTDFTTLPHVNVLGRRSDLGIATAMLLCWSLVAGRHWVKRCVPLVGLGVLAYSIYLFHLFGTAGMRVALHKLGIADVPTHLLLGTLAGLTLPMAAHYALRRVKWLGVA